MTIVQHEYSIINLKILNKITYLLIIFQYLWRVISLLWNLLFCLHGEKDFNIPVRFVIKGTGI
jgi:hypothetical protein